MKNTYKKLSRHQWTYESSSQQMLIKMARIGIANREIARELGYTDSQITYALHKAKVAAEMDQGFRMRWRYGNDPLVTRVLRDYSAIMVKEIQRDITPKIVHPVPQTVKVKD